MDVDEGETTIDEPVSAANPPHEPVYQCHVAPADNAPLTWSVELAPAHTGEFPLAETGLLGEAATLTIIFTQLEKQVPFSALMK